MAVHRSAENITTPSPGPGQPGYLESMFKKEREVYQSMQEGQNIPQSDSSEDEEIDRKRNKPRKRAKEYSEKPEHSSDSDSERSEDEEIALPQVKRKESSAEKVHENVENDLSIKMNNLSPVMSESPSQSRDENNANEKPVTETSFPEKPVTETSFPEKAVTETSFPENGDEPVSEKKSSETATPILQPEEKSGTEKLVAPPRNKKKIAPSQNFTFGQSPDRPEGENNAKRRPRKDRDRLRQLYKQGGFCYLVN